MKKTKTTYFISDLLLTYLPAILINVMIPISYVFPLFLFYFLMYWRLKNNRREKKEFLEQIGTQKFNVDEFSKFYFEQKGKNFFMIFIAFIAAINLLKILGVPFVNFLVMPQTFLTDMLLSFFGVSRILKNISSSIVSLAVNAAAFLFFQKKICPKVYETWANERPRYNAE